MSVFKLNEFGGYDELESLCLRSKTSMWQFDRFKSVSASMVARHVGCRKETAEGLWRHRI